MKGDQIAQDRSQEHLSNEPPPRPSHVVGIGASAGGLEALERLFDRMPVRTGMAFVVLQHLSPDFKSLTDELLARHTGIPIFRVEDGMEVRPDAIYLLPPRKDMIISGGKLLLTDKDPSRFVALPIDHFFRSLAQDVGERAIAIVLSGTGSDGSRGIRDVHEAGGLVLAQTAETAKFDGMPASAVRTGVVDLVLAPEDMSEALLQYIQPLNREQALPEPHAEPAPEAGMDTIFRLLRDAYGIDFSHYKPDTVARRTERRLLLGRSVGLDEYAAQLARDPAELNLLYKDLLIGVTRFFRDEEAFRRLAEVVLPPLLQGLGPDEEFRAWVPGCATGEEAYSLAILVQECLAAMHAKRQAAPPTVKIFATDVHRASLDHAGSGLYSEASLADMDPTLRERYFVRRADGWQISPELRKVVVFAQHNVLKDAPFTKLDLISCRNLLIYFQPPAQKKVLSLFHFGLKTGGVLFLGPSESPGELSDEFETIDPRWKLYRKSRDTGLPPDMRLGTLGGLRTRPPAGAAGAGGFENPLVAAYDALLDEHMPPSLLVNEHREVVQSFSGATRYLKLRDGRFSTDILDMVDPDLRMALAGALQRAFKDLAPVAYRGLRTQLPDGPRAVNLTVKPIRGRRPGRAGAGATGGEVVYTLIRFEEPEAAPPAAEPAREIDLGEASREQLLALETELRSTKENLQAMIEELETSNEELQATNEELLASNEELQSTNEELHSVNEELFTVNAEHQKKITELTELTADMDNLLASTEVHTIFLDRNLCIRKFTPKIAQTFNLLPQDVGRRIDHFTYSIDHPSLLTDVQEVLRTGQSYEHQVCDRRGGWFLLRILPYRAGRSVEGVVLTLIDIDRLKHAEADVRQKQQELAGILRNSPNWLFVQDLQGRYVLAGDAFCRAIGADPTGKTPHEIFPREVADVLAARDEAVLSGGTEEQTEVVLPRPDGPHTYLTVKFPLRDAEGRVAGTGGVFTDVTELKMAESQAREAVMQRDRFLAMLSHELRNPLGAVLNATRLLQLLGPGAAEAGQWFGVIERRSRHMARLLDDLLDVSRLTQDKIVIRKQLFDLSSTVDEVVEETRNWFAEQHLELSVARPEGPLPVDGDPTRLQQIQVNLLRNAAKYTPAGGRVWYGLRREGDEAVVRVRDTGVGLARDMLDKVFDLFVQADDTLDRQGGGIGVGLTLVRSIVELHGGRVRAFSDGPGKGSEFVVWLPLALRQTSVPDPVPLPVPEESLAGTASGMGRSGRQVLLVEDDEDIRSSLRWILEQEGFRVQAAGDGPAALAALDQGCPDVALVDIGIPGMSGYQLARRIRQRDGRRPYLIALTGYGRPGDRQAALEAGFDNHLTKPFDPRELARLLATLPAVADGQSSTKLGG
jgi:two-component system CheB/CheR fusion protein